MKANREYDVRRQHVVEGNDSMQKKKLNRYLKTIKAKNSNYTKCISNLESHNLLKRQLKSQKSIEKSHKVKLALKQQELQREAKLDIIYQKISFLDAKKHDKDIALQVRKELGSRCTFMSASHSFSHSSFCNPQSMFNDQMS